jgi:hypothetical protein
MPNRGVAFETMRSDGVKRLVVVSEALHFPSRAPHFVLGRWLLGHAARDSARMEHVVKASGLDWTIARPPRFVSSRDER